MFSKNKNKKHVLLCYLLRPAVCSSLLEIVGPIWANKMRHLGTYVVDNICRNFPLGLSDSFCFYCEVSHSSRSAFSGVHFLNC